MATIKSYNKRLENLRSERSSFFALYQELSDYHLSYRGRFLTSNRNKGYKRNTKSYNNTSRMASRTLASGMMAGITSPARPWFRLGTADKTLAENAEVKQWLHEVQSLIYRVFSQSNVYNSLHALYTELGVFGTATMGVFHDFDSVIWCKPYTVGSYFLGVDGRGDVDSFYREYEITVSQCVKQFGLENCSHSVQKQWSDGNTESWVKLVHLVEPNDDRDKQSPMAKDMPFRSVYYEVNHKNSNKSSEDKFLLQSGFDDFPILTPRWDLAGEDIYATDCPGMTALGDTKALQLGEKRKYQALDKIVSPPLQGPATLVNKVKNSGVGPNDVLAMDGSGAGLQSIYDFRPDLGAMEALNDKAEMRVKRAFYEDLFLMLANSDRRQITAREVAEKHEEKLLMLGPVLERLHNELLDPLIDRTFNILQKAGVLPVPPEALQNSELEVNYVSVLAQAQQLVALGSIERMGTYVSQIAAVWPEARHKFDAMQSVDDYAEAIGVDPSMVRSDEEANQRAAAEQQAAAQAAAMEQAQGMAQVAKSASETELSEDNALGTVMRNAGLA